MGTYNKEREELHKTIWSIAEELRGAVDGWEFKAYVLGAIFYRYISENLTDYINNLQAAAGIKDFDYAKMEDEEAKEAREMMVQEKGFFILPSDDSFLTRLNDLYIDHTETERRLIERYRIDTSNKDTNGRIRFLFGTGFMGDDPVLICAGNVNAVKLKYFVLNAGKKSRLSYILCRYRDLAVLQKVTEDDPIKVLTISLSDD